MNLVSILSSISLAEYIVIPARFNMLPHVASSLGVSCVKGPVDLSLGWTCLAFEFINVVHVNFMNDQDGIKKLGI